MEITVKHIVYALVLILALVSIVLLFKLALSWYVVRLQDKCNPTWALKEEFSGMHRRGSRTWKEFSNYMHSVPLRWGDKIHNNLYMQNLGVPGPDTVFMQYGQRAVDDLPRVLSGHRSYCAKASNMCLSLGIFIVDDGVLMQDVILPKDIVYKGPTKSGQRITVEEVVSAMDALLRISDPLSQLCNHPIDPDTTGIVVENVFPPHSLLKVYVALGEVVLIYDSTYSVKKFLSNMFTFKAIQKPNRMKIIRETCHAVANDLGIPFIRIDFMVPYDDHLSVRINELTITPRPDNTLGLGALAHMDDIVKYIDNNLRS